jgi:hypothetical protein
MELRDKRLACRATIRSRQPRQAGDWILGSRIRLAIRESIPVTVRRHSPSGGNGGALFCESSAREVHGCCFPCVFSNPCGSPSSNLYRKQNRHKWMPVRTLSLSPTERWVRICIHARYTRCDWTRSRWRARNMPRDSLLSTRCRTIRACRPQRKCLWGERISPKSARAWCATTTIATVACVVTLCQSAILALPGSHDASSPSSDLLVSTAMMKTCLAGMNRTREGFP